MPNVKRHTRKTSLKHLLNPVDTYTIRVLKNPKTKKWEVRDNSGVIFADGYGGTQSNYDYRYGAYQAALEHAKFARETGRKPHITFKHW